MDCGLIGHICLHVDNKVALMQLCIFLVTSRPMTFIGKPLIPTHWFFYDFTSVTYSPDTVTSQHY